MSKLARRIACVYALLFTLLVWGSWALLVNTREGQFIDDAAFKGSYWGAARIDDQARALLNAVSVPLIVVAIIATLAIALLRRRPRAALWATAVVVGTNVTIQALKHFVFTRPDWGYSQRVDAANTLPSGHTGVAASIAVALLLVVPPACLACDCRLGRGRLHLLHGLVHPGMPMAPPLRHHCRRRSGLHLGFCGARGWGLGNRRVSRPARLKTGTLPAFVGWLPEFGASGDVSLCWLP